MLAAVRGLDLTMWLLPPPTPLPLPVPQPAMTGPRLRHL